ncbi:NmrA-like family protein [Mollisia scopiformis]|uniref:NmrA-like family protein n=1 Tax=Mollisia scopiformis TaxID=149040 RepID=A0A194WS80_MOLSC|nr:NmrA-like family protein [Mollisia scopiformis]KUJ10823.1 NmrA-like family protein [Mollisia scopiformis]
MSSIKNVIVVGANGNIGSIVTQHLLSANFNVSILTRENSTSTTPPNAQVFQTDYSEASLASAFKGQDAVVSTVGVLGKPTQTKLIDAAIASGVKRFIPSDFAYKSNDMSDIERVIPLVYQRLTPNKTILDYLEAKAAQHPNFTWTAIGGGPLFDWTLKTGFLGTSIPNHTSTILDSGNESYATVTIPQLARAVVSTLSAPEKTANKYLTVTSFSTTQNEILAAAEKVTGQKFAVKRVGAQEWHREGLEQFGKGDFRGLGKLWGYFFWRDGEGLVKDVGDDNGMLGLPREDLESVIREVAGL